MLKSIYIFLTKSSFKNLLATTYVVGTLLLIAIATLITSNLSTKTVHDSLGNTGLQLVESFADRSRLALIYQSDQEAKLVASSILSFPDVEAAGIYNAQKEPIYVSNNQLGKISNNLSDNTSLLDYENEHEWVYNSAVFSTTDDETSPFSGQKFEPQLLGYVRLKVSKNALIQLKTDFYKYNLIVIGALASLLLWVILIITGRVTKPINNLAEHMQNAAINGSTVRADIGGTQDIIEMEEAFNNLMYILEKRESELLATRDLALDAAKVKGEFAANVSHELRTPLNGISGMLELLSEMSLTIQQKEYLEVASSSADSLLVLIDNVLDFSVYDQKDLILNEKSFNLRESLEEFIILLSPQAQRKNISIAYFIAEDVPKQLIGDNVRLQQILHNLLGNALKFTQEGDVSVSVSVSKFDNGTPNLKLLFEVTDTGIGIPLDAQERVFDVFAQVDNSSTREFPGTGLGLAICRQLVTLFGGEIGLTSSIKGGSTFWFTITVNTDESTNASLAALEAVYPAKTKILYVGDNPLCQRFISQHLTTLSYPAHYVENGTDALNQIRKGVSEQSTYDIIFIDELSSGISQTDLARFIHDDHTLNTTKVILTVNHHINDEEKLGHDIVSGYLTKPIRESDLLNQLSLNTTELIDEPSQTAIGNINKESPQYEHKHILVVEDNRSNQLVAKAMLERFKCKVSIANNGNEAIEMASRQTFDLIFMDCQMPGMDGYEATYQLRLLESKEQHITIIAMTANNQVGDREKCLAVGMDDFISKPLKLELLADMLGKWFTPNAEKITIVNSEEALSSNENVIDEVAYSYMEENIGKEITTILALFQEDTPDYLNKLDVGIKNNDLTILSSTSHAIKSSAASLGALRLSNACQTMEIACKDEDFPALSLHYKRITFEANQAMKAIALKLNPNKHHKRESDRKASELNPNNNRVLIIDDDRSSRFTIKQALEKEGYLVDEVINGKQALMYCERVRPDLIILDAVMPGLGGFETCEKITHQFGESGIPIIMITALDNEACINRAIEVGADDYLTKPINFSLLKLRVHRLLSVKHAEKQMSDLAHKDALTGLMNRSQFTTRTAEALSRHLQRESIMAIMFLDLNRFKLVNDSYGHEAGDLLLKVIAERLTRSVRHEDIVSRFGGDGFVIALTNIKSYEVIEKLARKIQSNISRPFVFLGKEMHVAASIGISVSPANGTNISDLIKHADIAMHTSKETKVPYVFYDRSMQENINDRLSIENDLRNAIARDELKVFYQPQFSLSTGELIGMEALIRWIHPEKGFIPPDSFIGLSEETGQIHQIGEWVLKTACDRLKSWLDQGAKPFRVAVNLSAYQLQDDEIVKQISSVVEKSQLPNHLLELEITESSVMNNEESVIEKLDALKAQGIKLAIDDFGTGYSSLSYLKRFPINLLKIDRSFINNSLNDKVDADIIRTIVVLAHSMGVEVIAEGVETEEQSDLLKNLNCDYVQGYFYGKPMPADQFEKTFLPHIANSINTSV